MSRLQVQRWPQGLRLNCTTSEWPACKACQSIQCTEAERALPDSADCLQAGKGLASACCGRWLSRPRKSPADRLLRQSTARAPTGHTVACTFVYALATLLETAAGATGCAPVRLRLHLPRKANFPASPPCPQEGLSVQQQADSAHLQEWSAAPRAASESPQPHDSKMGSVCSNRHTARTCRSVSAAPWRLQLLWRCEAWAALIAGPAAQEPAAKMWNTDNITGDQHRLLWVSKMYSWAALCSQSATPSPVAMMQHSSIIDAQASGYNPFWRAMGQHPCLICSSQSLCWHKERHTA